MNVLTKKWFKAAMIRALKTVAQSAAAGIGTSALISRVDLKTVVLTAITAGVLSLLTSVAGIPEAA